MSARMCNNSCCDNNILLLHSVMNYDGDANTDSDVTSYTCGVIRKCLSCVGDILVCMHVCVCVEMLSSVQKVSNILCLWWRNFTSCQQSTVSSMWHHCSTQLHLTSPPVFSKHSVLVFLCSFMYTLLPLSVQIVVITERVCELAPEWCWLLLAVLFLPPSDSLHILVCCNVSVGSLTSSRSKLRANS